MFLWNILFFLAFSLYFRYDNDKYRKLYFAAKNKLEYNGIPFSEFKVLEEYGLA